MQVHIEKDGTLVIETDSTTEEFALRSWYEDFLAGNAKVELRDSNTAIRRESGGRSTTLAAVGAIQREAALPPPPNMGEMSQALDRLRGLHNLVDVRGGGQFVLLFQDDATKEFFVKFRDGSKVYHHKTFGGSIDKAIAAEVSL
jgi:hypothetical protein